MSSNIHYLSGDVTNPQIGDHEKAYIPHICNNIGKWGAGFTKALDEKWDEPRKKYLELYNQHDEDELLGHINFAVVEHNVTIVNMVAQNGVRHKDNPTPIDYESLDICLSKLSNKIKTLDEDLVSIHMPRIGVGFAGGKWEDIEPLIDKWLVQNGNLNVYVYVL